LLTEKFELNPIEGHVSFAYEPQLDLPIDLEIGGLEFTFAPDEWKQGAVSVRFPNSEMPPDEAGTESNIKLSEVVLRVEAPKGAPPATGSVLVHYLKNGDREGVRRVGAYKRVSIEEGIGKWTLPVPNQIGVEAEGMTGYWFEPRRSIDIDASGVTFAVHATALFAFNRADCLFFLWSNLPSFRSIRAILRSA